MTATVGVVACTGVATAALIIRRDSAEKSGVASAPTTRWRTRCRRDDDRSVLGRHATTTFGLRRR
jgi:hypothetical protein